MLTFQCFYSLHILLFVYYSNKQRNALEQLFLINMAAGCQWLPIIIGQNWGHLLVTFFFLSIRQARQLTQGAKVQCCQPELWEEQLD